MSADDPKQKPPAGRLPSLPRPSPGPTAAPAPRTPPPSSGAAPAAPTRAAAARAAGPPPAAPPARTPLPPARPLAAAQLQTIREDSLIALSESAIVQLPPPRPEDLASETSEIAEVSAISELSEIVPVPAARPVPAAQETQLLTLPGAQPVPGGLLGGSTQLLTLPGAQPAPGLGAQGETAILTLPAQTVAALQGRAGAGAGAGMGAGIGTLGAQGETAILALPEALAGALATRPGLVQGETAIISLPESLSPGAAPGGAAGPRKDPSETAIVASSPRFAGVVPDPSGTAILGLPETGGRRGSRDDETRIQPASNVSLGARATSAVSVSGEGAGDATAIRHVFARFGERDGGDAEGTGRVDLGRVQRAGREKAREGALTRALASPRALGGLAVGLVVGGLVWIGGVVYTRGQRLQAVGRDAQAAFAEAHQRGRLADFVAAEARVRAWRETVPTDGAIRGARALLLSEAQLEFGGGPQLDDGSEWEPESQSAARQAESEPSAAAQAALSFQALAQGDRKAAEQHIAQLRTPGGEQPAPGGDPAGARVPPPPGMAAYLAGLSALLEGKDDDALGAVRRAVEQSPLPLWQRRLAQILAAQGREDEALAALKAAQARGESCGVQVDALYLSGRAGPRAARDDARRTLRTFLDPPRTGPDPCGRGEHARAALWLAELTLLGDPTARTEARAHLERAQAPSDVLFTEALTQAWLRVGDAAQAVTTGRALLERAPQRRGARLLLAEALLASDRANEALSTLEPLLGGGAGKAGDLQAQLLRARALLLMNDTLEAQQAARQVLGAAERDKQPAAIAVRTDAQLVLAQVFLKLQELAAARRTLEPLVQKAEQAGPLPAGAGPGPGAKAAASPTQAQLLQAQLLWAQMLLVTRPPQQSEARALLESVIVRAPERVEARLMLGRLLRELGDWAMAEQQLSAALRTDEQYTPARRELAALLLLRGDFGKARALYTALRKNEQDAELLLSAARAERLDGSPDQALSTLGEVRRSRGEVTTRYDEGLLAERGRALLALDRSGEAVALLRGPVDDLAQLKRPTLPALLVRGAVGAAAGPERTAQLERARAQLTKLPAPWRADPDVRLAEAELLLGEGNAAGARPVLRALIDSLQKVSPAGTGEETALRQRAERLLDKLP